MPRYRFEFEMPANTTVAFDAFHFTVWRNQWDSLVRNTVVQDGAPCPFPGAKTSNRGSGLLSLLSMETTFISFDRPKVAAAIMNGKSFPFSRWAASMQHKELPYGQSMLIYTYSFEVWPLGLSWLMQPFVSALFNYQTHRRFKNMQAFLKTHASQIENWQKLQLHPQATKQE
jgi:hypothetical protein